MNRGCAIFAVLLTTASLAACGGGNENRKYRLEPVAVLRTSPSVLTLVYRGSPSYRAISVAYDTRSEPTKAVVLAEGRDASDGAEPLVAYALCASTRLPTELQKRRVADPAGRRPRGIALFAHEKYQREKCPRQLSSGPLIQRK